MQFEIKFDRDYGKTRVPSVSAVSKYLSILILFFLATSCTPSTSDVTTDYNINGDFTLEFTVLESTRDDQAVGSMIESKRSFSTNGNIVSATGENADSVAQGPRVGNTITLTRTTGTGIKIDTTLTLTSNNSFTGSTTAFYPDDSKVTGSLVGTRQ